MPESRRGGRTLRVALAALLFAGALLLALRAGERPRSSTAGPASPAGRPVILLMLDTVRADHLGFFGYERDTSPNLDAFARDSLAFKYAFTAAPWTPPSVATMLTGLYPTSHGHQPPDASEDVRTSTRRLAPELMTLAEILRPLGYGTAAVSPNPWISALFGFDQGFETFDYRPKAAAAEIVTAGIGLIEGFARRNQPFFLYLHFLDPHDPYTPPASYAKLFPERLSRADYAYPDHMQPVLRNYDREIRYLDDELGRLFDHLKRSGLYERALIVVIADHGEQFREHGHMHHGHALHNEELHVPFFVRDPLSDRPAGVVEQVVSTVDLFPTILGQLGAAPPAGQADGVSVFDDERLAARSGVISEIRRARDQRGFISRERRKAIFAVPLRPDDASAGRPQLWRTPRLVGVYDFEQDPFEQHRIHDPEAAARLRSELDAAFGRLSSPQRPHALIPQGEMSEELLEQLKALGYLNAR